MSRNPICEVMFSLVNTPPQNLELPGLTLQSVHTDNRTAKFDITLHLTERPDGLACTWEFATDLFLPATIQRMHALLQNMLELVLANPEQTLNQVEALPHSELAQLEVWNQTQTQPVPWQLCNILADHALQRPDAPALTFGEETLNYADLYDRVVRLAAALKNHGAEPETIVAVHMDRSLEMVIALLATLHVGAAYLPLDPAYPEARIAFMLQDAEPTLVLTHGTTQLPQAPETCRLLRLDHDGQELDGAWLPPADLLPRGDGLHLAYLIYTSGSTGQPKAVGISRANLANFLAGMQSHFHLGPGKRFLALTTVSFDIAALELFLPLLDGAELLLADRATAEDGHALAEFIAQHRPHMMQATPATWQLLLAAKWQGTPQLIALCGGEALAGELAKDLEPKVASLHNLYGPTETTIWSSYLAVDEAQFTRETPHTISIGQPILNTSLHLLDTTGKPVPIGAVGALLIGGSGLARGYLGRPALTATRFVPNPFDATPGARMYQTGDLARYQANGQVQFLGRSDFQVKIRGHRIELGEIEAQLNQLPEVTMAICRAWDFGQGDVRLCAYVALEQALTATAMESHLRANLPDYMVPTSFVEIIEWPRTPNGKIDRQKLPQPQVAAAVEDVFVAPETTLEIQLANIFCEVLNVEKVGVHDNFFRMGGHSLLATQTITRIHEQLGRILPVRSLFETPTIAQLALKLQETTVQSTAPAIQPRPADVTVPLSFAQQRLWFLQQLAPESPAYNMQIQLAFDHSPNLQALGNAVSQVVKRHEVLRTRFDLNAQDQPVQIVVPPFQALIQTVDISDMPADQQPDAVANLVQLDADTPFDLTQLPLFRMQVIYLSAKQAQLIVNMHHIISDGWSLGVMAKEVKHFYDAMRAKQRIHTEPLPIQYGDYAHWQQTSAAEHQAALEWWCRQFQSLPEPLGLVTDGARPDRSQSPGGLHFFNIPQELTQRLTDLAEEQQVTAFMLVFSAYQILLQAFSDQQDIVIGTPVTNRPSQELEALIGPFINTLALRTPWHGQMAFTEALQHNKNLILEAFAHQHIPFEQIVEVVQPQRDLSSTPLFQALLVFQNYPVALEAAEHDQNAALPAARYAKFDITLSVAQRNGQFACSINYPKNRFHPETITQIANQFENILSRIAEAPTTSTARLTTLSAKPCIPYPEHFSLANAVPSAALLNQILESNLTKHGDLTALAFGDQSLSYAELHRQANQLAHHLLAQGLEPATTVAVFLPAGIPQIVSLLAVFKAGLRLVILDPTLPELRLGYISKDSHAAFLIHDQTEIPTWASELSQFNQWSDLETFPDEHPTPNIQTEQVAYLIYTSGSTGQPKGVAVSHRAITQYIVDLAEVLQLDTSDRVLLGASLAFDASLKQLLAPLLAGACVVGFDSQLPTPYQLCQHVLAGEITAIHSSPAYWSQIVQEWFEADWPTPQLRYMETAGDVMPVASVKHYFACGLKSVPLRNSYGPTEAVVSAITGEVYADDLPSRMPLGRALPGRRLYLLDRELYQVAAGIPAELYIGGQLLAQGYFGKPRETAAAFLPDPSAPEPGARMYRTGDRMRVLHDGRFDYLGRFDFQVKIRGFRIELGEIEARLIQHPMVSEAVVVSRVLNQADPQLIAYVVADDTALEHLPNYLAQHLPAYMLPDFWVPLENLPRTVSGKVSRKQLPNPEPLAVSVADDQQPQSIQEQQLADIFAEVLQVTQVPRTHSFFDLGGHSLLATRVISLIRKRLGMELPLRALFETPTVAALAETIRDQSDHQPPPMKRVSRDQPIPLSFAQQRLWFLDQLEAGSAFYNIPMTVRLRGALCIAAMEKALQAIVQRHEVLRTRFGDRHGEPVQIILPHLAMDLQIMDLSTLASECQQATAHQLANQEAQSNFNLATGPLLHMALVRLAKHEHLLLFNVHHIVSDGWSSGLFTKELAAFYAHFQSAQPLHLPQLPIQYADFSVWQRQWLQGEVLEAQFQWWEQQFAGKPRVLELPTDFARPAVEQFRGDKIHGQFSAEITQGLQQLASEEQATLYMVLMAGFNLLLMHYSGAKQIAVGSPIANRNRHEVEDLIGFFANTLVIHTDLSGNPTTRELISRVKKTTLGAYAHQDLPFESLVDRLKVKRDMSRSPLFQVMLALQNMPRTTVDTCGLSIEQVRAVTGIAKFDLTLFLWETNGVLAYMFEFNTDLFEQATAQRMMDHLQALLGQMVAAPTTPVEKLHFLPPQELQQQMVDWNQTADPRSFTSPFLDMIQRHCQKDGQQMAVEMEPLKLTYAELDAHANALAHELVELGVGPERVVGIMLERSLEMAICFLAVLKAGGAVVALDPEYPEERLNYVIRDAGLTVLLTHSSYQAVTRQIHDITIVNTDDLLQSQPIEIRPPQPHYHLDQPLYVIYTSGSTGEPKGIAVSHRAILNLLDWQERHTSLQGAVRTLQFAAFGFCVSFQEMLSTWCAGGTLVIASETIRRNPELLLAYVRECRIQRLHLPFAALKQLAMVAQHAQSLPQDLTDVITAGEQLQITPEIRAFFRRLGQCHLHNQYGSSETHVITALTLKDGAEDWPVIPSAGRPISRTQIYLLNPHLDPVPLGSGGELYAGGEALARAYVNQPALTAVKFVPDPFSQEPGARLYRTGDVARYRANGNIQFLGRADAMVKVRGYRVDLGEVETWLRKHPAVKDVAVLALQDEGYFLAAYIVANDADAALFHDLVRFLKPHLPGHAIPQSFAAVDVLPVTTHGKLDRDALPEPHKLRMSEQAFQAPQTATEIALAAIWSDVLGVAQVSREDDFFELGGHSLLATKVMSRVREHLADVPLRALFEESQLWELAQRIDRQEAVTTATVVPMERPETLPLSYAQQRLWIIDSFDPGATTYNMAGNLPIEGNIDPSTLEKAINWVVARHESLRTYFGESADQEPFQAIVPELHVPLQILDLTQESETQFAAVAQEHANTRFDLTQLPLIRVCLVHRNADQAVLLVNMHHIISDGWSVGVMLRETQHAYEAFLNHQNPSLPPLTWQYADFTLWQRSQLQGEVLGKQLPYWQQQLQPLPEPLQLPADYPRPAKQSFSGETLTTHMPSGLANALHQFAKKSATTPFVTALATFKLLLYRLTQQADLTVGTPIANRQQTAVEPLIGFFVNTLALRTDFHSLSQAGPANFIQLLTSVKETALGAFSHQDLPFEKLVEVLQPERDLTRSPLFQVMFILQNASEPGSATPVTIANGDVEISQGVAKFDLTLSLIQVGDQFKVQLNYNRDLFSQGRMRRMLDYYFRLLHACLANPQHSIHRYAFMADGEYSRLLSDWNPPSLTGASPELGLHGSLAATAKQHPQAIALVSGELTWSYARVDQITHQWAHWLRHLGAGRDQPIAICCERSPEMVLALIAILKAGSGYLPLDPQLPSLRLKQILEIAKPRLILTTTAFAGRFHEADPVALLDDQTEPWTAFPQTPFPASCFAEQMAYTIFTSGSTGVPKGVVNQHGAIGNRLRWMQAAYGLQQDDAILQKTPYSFDVSVWEFFWPMMVGARLVIAPPDAHKDPQHLLKLIEAHNITTLHFVPSMLAAFLDELEQHPQSLPQLRRVICSGEALDWQLLQRAEQHLPCPVFNLYGPTEAAVDVTAWAGTSDTSTREVPIGQPIDHVQIHMLDRQMHLVPHDVPGELHIGGIAPARGYIGEPALTAASFVPDPFSKVAGSRLYKTGDLAQWDSQGQILYRGRIDFQIKLRGLRVELGDIQSQLRALPDVADAVVRSVESSSGAHLLVAYLVPAKEARLDLEHQDQWRAVLAQTLPDYMVPGAFVVLDAFPLSANGKLDLKRLPAPERITSSGDLPKTPEEALVCQIFAQLLDIETVGVDQDFFRLGGHSLLALRLVGRLRSEFTVSIGLWQVFQTPTPKALAAWLVAQAAQTDFDIACLPAADDYALSDSQKGLWLLDQLQEDSSALNISTAYRIAGSLNLDAFKRSFQALIDRHEILRTVFIERDGQPRQKVRPVGHFPLTVLDNRSGWLSDAAVQEKIDHHAAISFDLEQGPLITGLVIIESDQSTLFALSLHHLIGDAWSLEILSRELIAFYQQDEQDHHQALPELAFQYKDYAAWFNSYLNGTHGQADRAYWLETLAGTPGHVSFPTDFAANELQSFAGDTYSFQIEAPQRQGLEELLREHSATHFMGLTALLYMLLYRYTSQEDLIVGVPGSGRDREVLAHQVGYYLNMLALRTHVQGNDSAAAVLQKTKATILGAFKHQHYPYPRLVSDIASQRSGSASKLTNIGISMNYLDVLGQTTNPDLDLQFKPIGKAQTTAKDDLCFLFADRGTAFGVTLIFNTDLFKKTTIVALAEHFETLLSAVLENPQIAVEDIVLEAATSDQRPQDFEFDFDF